MKFLKYAAYTAGFFIVVSMAMDVFHLATTTKAERETAARVAAAKKDAEDAIANRRAALLMAANGCAAAHKRQMKNPASFELVDYSSDGKKVYIVYRGTNSFNAIVTDTGWCKI